MEQQPMDFVKDLYNNFTAYFPTFILGLSVLLLGLAVAWISSRILVRLLIFLRLDRVIARLGWARALDKGDVRHSLFSFIGMVVGIFIFLIFLDDAVSIWHLTVLSQLLQRLVLAIPKIIIATIVMLVGWGIAGIVSHTIRRALYQEEFTRARLVGRIVHAAIVVTAAALALVEMNIAAGLVTGAFLITFGSLGLSFVLAFGLGSKRAVESMWDERLGRGNKERQEEKKPPDADRH